MGGVGVGDDVVVSRDGGMGMGWSIWGVRGDRQAEGLGGGAGGGGGWER